MSNDDQTPPDQPADPSGSAGGSTGETGPGDSAPGGAATGEPPAPDVGEPTQVIPTTPPPTGTPAPGAGTAAGAAGGAAAGAAGAAGGPRGPSEFEPPVDSYELPWYKQPGRLALVLFAVLAVIGLIALLIFLASDDDGAEFDIESPLSIVVTRIDDTGTPLVTPLTAVVSAGDLFPDAYVWVVPSDALPGDPATRSTDADGRAEFRWEAVVVEGTEPEDWRSTVEVGEVVSAERAEAGVRAQCTVERGDDASPEALAVETTYAGDATDSATPRIATYSFPNAEFTPGSRIACQVQDNPLTVETTTTTVPETTTTEESTTTVPETTTTTVPETTTTTTVPPTTTTTVPPTTTTTVPPTTTTTTVAPPVVNPGSALEFMNSRSDLTSFVGIISQAGLIDEFNDPARVMTVLAPDNDAVAALAADPNAPDLGDPGVLRDLVRAHVVDGQALLRDQIAALSELPVQFGGPQPVDPGPPVLVGGAEITDIDHQATASVVQIIDTVLTPVI